MLRVIELFGGIGAFSSALDRLKKDYEIVDYVDKDSAAVQSYNAIHNTNFPPQDITKWNKNPQNIDIIMSGSPCQSVSVIGKNKGADKGSGTRSSLLWENIRIAKSIRPKVLIWENVKGILTKRHKKNYDLYKQELEEIGYKNYSLILNAADFGVPQQRIRVFTISILKDSDVIFNYKEPKRIPKVNINTILESKVGNKFYLKEEARTKLINNTLAMENGERILILNKPYIAASRGRNILNPNDRTSGVKTLVQRLEPNESYLSFTLTTVQKDNYVVEEGMKIRKLTPLESWRLMGFTDDEFAAAEYVSTNSQLIKQAGNSIVVNCLVYILEMLEGF